ncbi:Taurine-transporting ATPase [Syntrophobotulus glycolicus DSM 8271]|uniref:Taurine-transporting ATPase n=1 Tax=Syntrophobotulus glycolicus (strain DSM 8271 / FlGlyR) TaxID=645991 RepID=F0SXK6_SYNGF|nr:ABC transporter ATP-binding protein [Syntrophobotulus glycolicus]ADY55839.1 Taurine-transporting ATPase [Syntrophobotulus glycolicus DSM 8271]
MSVLPEKSEYLTIEDLNKSFMVNQNTVPVLEKINLQIKQGEFVSIVGSSGCGKSTLLRVLAGLETEYEGSVVLKNEKILQPGLERGIVFQEHRLFPWLTVKNNIAYALKNISKEEKEQIIEEHIKMTGLKGFEDAYPGQLSGGMAQRTSLARALVNRPEVLLLDEPFGALDAFTKIQMQHEIMRIREKEKATMILVTHDIDEAIFLGDRVVVMSSRPGTVRKIFPVGLGRNRDRSNPDFINIRRAIYQEFFEQKEQLLDYVI